MSNLKHVIDGEKIRTWINDDEFYETNSDGEGLFYVKVSRNTRRQLEGTCDFTLRGRSDSTKKRVMREIVKAREENAINSIY